MSEFFRALEQAERDRSLSQQERRAPADVEEAAEPEAPAAPAPAAAEASAHEPPAVAAPPPRPPLPTPFRKPTEEPLSRPAAPDAPDGVEGHMVSLVTPSSFGAEQYRALRHVIEQLRATANIAIVAVSSPSVGDGKTTTAVNLAGALAQARDARVLLVDADVRRPSIVQQLALGDPAGSGLVGAIVNRDLKLEQVVRRRPPFNLSILPAGRPPAAPYELLKSPRFGELLAVARERYDFVVVDTPPLVGVPDCRVVAQSVDGFVVVVAAHRTPRKMLAEALSVLEPAKVIGLVYNRDDRPLSGYYGYGEVYGRPSNGHSARRLRRFLPRRRALRGS